MLWWIANQSTWVSGIQLDRKTTTDCGHCLTRRRYAVTYMCFHPKRCIHLFFCCCLCFFYQYLCYLGTNKSFTLLAQCLTSGPIKTAHMCYTQVSQAMCTLIKWRFNEGLLMCFAGCVSHLFLPGEPSFFWKRQSQGESSCIYQCRSLRNTNTV